MVYTEEKIDAISRGISHTDDSICFIGLHPFHNQSNKKSRIDSIHHTQILFFSDENQIDQEASYYDALLDLEKDYPDQIDKMKVYDNRKGWEDEIETVPTLMVVDQRHVVVKIEGCVKKKEDIIKPLQHVLSK